MLFCLYFLKISQNTLNLQEIIVVYSKDCLTLPIMFGVARSVRIVKSALSTCIFYYDRNINI